MSQQAIRRQWGYRLMLGLGCLLIGLPSMMALTVQVFTDPAHPVSTAGVADDVVVHYYDVTALSQGVATLNEQIAHLSPTDAEQQANQWLAKHRPMLLQAIAAQRYIQQYGITQIPTMVFDQGHYQIRGQRDLAAALAMYQQWRQHEKTT